MWLPKSAQEVEAVASAGDLEEGPALDAKRELDREGWKLAVDVAAMSTDGGVIIVGLDEDANKRLTVPTPFALAGVEERIAAIVGSGVAEAPYIDIRPLPLDNGTGYMLIHVPMSPRAPHQVIAKGKAEGRFYGRYGSLNRILNEADIARLYERRQRWQMNGHEELAKLLAADPPHALEPGRGYLQAFAYPVMPDLAMWERATGAAGDAGQLRAQMALVARNAAPGNYSPTLHEAVNWVRVGGDVWALDTDYGEGPYGGVRVEIEVNGRGQLFMARAADSDPRHAGGELIMWEAMIAGNLASFLALMGRFYDLAGYFGPVSIGLSVHGIQGAKTSSGRRGFLGDGRPYGKPDFTRVHTAGAAVELHDARPLALGLVQNLIDASAYEGYDPLG